VGGQALRPAPGRATRGPLRRALRASGRNRALAAGLAGALVLPVAAPTGLGAQETLEPAVTRQESGVSVLLQAVSPVSDAVAWVSGHGGTWLRTLDGGQTWRGGIVPGADTLQFRDVHALSADTAWLLSAGPGDMSRIYRTTDGGASWTLQWTNPEPEGFYDCLSFFDGRRGLAYGDAVRGELRVLRTEDGGETWSLVPAGRLPEAQPGEGGFAASGTCVELRSPDLAWIGTGNAGTARVLRSEDGGGSWTASATPVAAGEAAGITSLAFRDDRHGIAVGGDLARPAGEAVRVTTTADGGATWTPAGSLRIGGPAYGARGCRAPRVRRP
jgi:photosystem II stability/assembly factor-like uncharacterized protein